jgi:hypothetical protein
MDGEAAKGDPVNENHGEDEQPKPPRDRPTLRLVK